MHRIGNQSWMWEENVHCSDGKLLDEKNEQWMTPITDPLSMAALPAGQENGVAPSSSETEPACSPTSHPKSLVTEKCTLCFRDVGVKTELLKKNSCSARVNNVWVARRDAAQICFRRRKILKNKKNLGKINSSSSSPLW